MAPPDVFRSKRAGEARRKFREFYFAPKEVRAQTRFRSEAKVYLSREMRATLFELFRGKCAFCERKLDAPSANIKRFRPSTEAVPTENAETSNLYYTWLAEAWENYYLSCAECWVRKGTRFPVIGKRCPLPTRAMVDDYVKRGDGYWGHFPLQETSLYLDPCFDEPLHEHFQALRSGELIGKTDRGIATIEIFGLNRSPLVSHRADRVRLQLLQMHLDSELRADSGFFNFEELEYGGFWYLLLRDCVLHVDGAGLTPDQLTPATIVKRFAGRQSEEFTRYFTDNAPAAPVGRVDIAEDSDVMAPAAQSVEVPQAAGERLERIIIRNFKAIESIELSLGTGRTDDDTDARREPALLILGENSAGKSSILEAVALALCTQEQRAALKLKPGNLMLDPALLGQASPARRRGATISVGFDAGNEYVLKIASGGFSSQTPERRIPVFAYGAFRQYLAGSSRAHSASEVVSLFRSDAILSDPEKWLLGLTDDAFSKVARALRDIFAIDGDFQVIRLDKKKDRCMIVNGPGKGASETPIGIASSGFRSVLGMVCEVMQGLLAAGVGNGVESFDSIRAVVLVDEVEAHLHPRWKMQIMAGLRAALPAVTFIVTTHDPLCLRGMENGEVVVARRVRSDDDGGSGSHEKVELLTGLPDLTKLSIEQLLTSDFFSLASTEARETEDKLSALGSLLGRSSGEPDLSEEEQEALSTFRDEIADALPIGSGAVQQMIQGALGEFLRGRRTKTAAQLAELNRASKDTIIHALGMDLDEKG